jgi:glutamine amidotransferase
MCKLFAISASEPIRINKELAAFIKGSYVHKHGWGFVDFTGDEIVFHRETEPAYESDYLKERLFSPFIADHTLFHIRYATVGAIDINNTHPIVGTDDSGRKWAIIHNGTLFNSDKFDRFYHSQDGDSDTERLLLFLLERINHEISRTLRALSAKERFDVVRDALIEASNGNKLNVVISDTELIYVHGNSPHGSRLLGPGAENDYIYELNIPENGENSVLLSTVPLDDREWVPVPLNVVRAFKDGTVVFKSEPHKFEYIEKEEDIHDLYQGYANL